MRKTIGIISKMRILITGAAGQLGCSLQDTAPAGADIVATDVHNLDLTQTAALAAALDEHAPDVIINAAAYTAVDKAESEPELARVINADAVATLADWCRASGARLVHISTDFVFAGDNPQPRRPDDATGPLSVYGRTKLAGEQAALQGCRQTRIIRTSWVYSEHGHNFVKTMLRLGAERDALTVVDDQVGSPTYARNLARAVWQLVETWPDERLLHFSDAGEISWRGFAQAIFADAVELGLLAKAPTVAPISTKEYGAPAPRPAYSVMDTTLTTTVLGIETVPWRTALRDMLARLGSRH